MDIILSTQYSQTTVWPRFQLLCQNQPTVTLLSENLEKVFLLLSFPRRKAAAEREKNYRALCEPNVNNIQRHNFVISPLAKMQIFYLIYFIKILSVRSAEWWQIRNFTIGLLSFLCSGNLWRKYKKKKSSLLSFLTFFVYFFPPTLSLSFSLTFFSFACFVLSLHKN